MHPNSESDFTDSEFFAAGQLNISSAFPACALNYVNRDKVSKVKKNLDNQTDV